MDRPGDIDRAVAHLRDVLETRLAGMDAARALQFTEFMRRLEELNHAHQKAVDDRALFLPREVYDASQKEIRVWRDEIGTAVVKAKTQAEALAGEARDKATRQAALIASLIGLGTLFLGHYWR